MSRLEVVGPPAAVAEMTEAEARAATTEIRQHMEAAWRGLLEIHERKGYRALGYPTFAEYLAGELAVSRSRGYQLLDKARVTAAIASAAGVETSNMLDTLPARKVAAVKPKLAAVAEEVAGRVEAGEDPDVAVAEVLDMATRTATRPAAVDRSLASDGSPPPAPDPAVSPVGDTVAERHRKRHGISPRRKPVDPAQHLGWAVARTLDDLRDGTIADKLVGFDYLDDPGHSPMIDRAELADIAELEPIVLVEVLAQLDELARGIGTLRKAIVRAQREAADRGGQR